MADEATYIYGWHRCGRKGQRCRVTARVLKADMRPLRGARLWFLIGPEPKPKRFGSVRVEFEDGFVMITSQRALRRLAACQKK